MYDAILVPTDGSDPAETAAAGAVALADRFDAELYAIHVVDLADVPEGAESEASRERTERGEAALAAVVDRADAAGVAVTADLVETSGPVHREIVDYAVDHDVDLVVAGTQGRTGFERLYLGSVAERTLRTSPVPVLTVHEDTPVDPDLERVLVPTDGSESADLAADHAIALAEATGASLDVVHVVDVTAIAGEYGSGGVFEALEAAGRDAVDRVVDRGNAAEISSVQASVLDGSPSRAIADYAADREVDLVVMGTHGRSGISRYLLGSVAERVVRRSPAPVITVRRSRDDE